MTALADNRSLDQLNADVPPVTQIGLAANAHPFMGSACAIATAAAGFVNTASAANSGTNPVLGVANMEQDNTGGANGAKSVSLAQGSFRRVNSGSDPVAEADVWNVVYAEDDQTIAKTDATGTLGVMGIFLGFEDDGVTPIVLISGKVNKALTAP